MLEKLIELDVPGDAKQGELSKVIESVSKNAPDQLVLIFTEYLATQDFLIGLLEHAYGKGWTAIIRGGMSVWEKKKNTPMYRLSSASLAVIRLQY